MDVGASLRHARLRKKLTLEQLAKATKIRLSTLEAFENNDFERLPPAVYTRGFLRTYAREVGLHPDETVEQYLAQLEEVPPMVLAAADQDTDVQRHAASSQAPTVRQNAAGATAAHAAAPSAPASSGAADARPDSVRTARVLLFNNRRIAVPVGAALAVLILIAGYFTVASRGDAKDAVANAAVQASAPVPRATDVVRAADVAPEGLRVEFKATGLCWVSATKDRKPAFARLMSAGESETLDATDEFVVRVGDPSTLSVTINGVPARPLGRPGEPITVVIDKDNYRQFQAPESVARGQ